MADPGGPGAGPDPNTTNQEATDWFNLLVGFASATPTAAFIQQHAALGQAMAHIKLPSAVAKIIGAILSGLADIAAGALNGLGDIKNESGEGINNLISATLADLLGTTVSIQGTSDSGSGNPTVNGQQTGAAVWDALIGILNGLQQVSPDDGATNAKALLGFGVNFAMVTAFLGIVGGLVPILHLEELKGLGEELHSALGLGRLSHTALRPLVQNLITKPLDLYMMNQTRPTRLAEAQYVRALRHGDMDEGEVTQALQEKGYSDDLIAFLLSDLSVKLGLTDLVLLNLNGDVSDQDVINNLTLSGMPEDQANLQFKAAQLVAVKTQQSALISWAEGAYENGYITGDQWNAILQDLMLSDLEEAALRKKEGWKQETPRKRVTFAELKAAIVDNIAGFDDLDTWLTNEGYDPSSQNILNWQVLTAIKNAEQKVEFAKYKAAALLKAGKPVPPWVTAAAQPVP